MVRQLGTTAAQAQPGLSGSRDAVVARTLLFKRHMLDLVLTQSERVKDSKKKALT
jgi:hypothetical protein